MPPLAWLRLGMLVAAIGFLEYLTSTFRLMPTPRPTKARPVPHPRCQLSATRSSLAIAAIHPAGPRVSMQPPVLPASVRQPATGLPLTRALQQRAPQPTGCWQIDAHRMGAATSSLAGTSLYANAAKARSANMEIAPMRAASRRLASTPFASDSRATIAKRGDGESPGATWSYCSSLFAEYSGL